MTLRARVILAQLPALIVMLLILTLGSQSVESLGAQSRDILHQNYRSVLAAQRMKESVERLDSAALFRVADEIAAADVLVREHVPLFEAELAVEEQNITEPGEREHAAALRAAWVQYQAIYDRFVAAPAGSRREIYFSSLLPAFRQVKEEAEQVLILNQDAMAQKSDRAVAHADETRRAWLGWSALGLLAAAVVGAALSHRLTVPLHAVARSAARVGAGQLDVELQRTGIEELDTLAASFNEMAARLRQIRRASESELAQAREAAQAAIESLADPVLVLAIDGAVRAANGAARRRLSLEGALTLTRLDPGLRAAIEAAHLTVVREGRPLLPADFRGVVVLETEEGELVLLPRATPINDAVTGELVGVTVLLQDVTRLRRLDELKGDLIQTVAHELRTPLTSLGMAMHLALDERVSGPLQAQLSTLLVAAREDVGRLRALVEDLLDLSRVQEGRVVLHREAVPTRALLQEVRDRVEAAMSNTGVTCIIAPDIAPEQVVVDRPRLRLALSNLVHNAVRHAPAGSEVRISAHDLQGVARFEVDDAGPGVPPEERAHIFDPFVRGADERGEGAGLGLSIAREVVRAHGGAIGVETSPSGGARFWIEIPR